MIRVILTLVLKKYKFNFDISLLICYNLLITRYHQNCEYVLKNIHNFKTQLCESARKIYEILKQIEHNLIRYIYPYSTPTLK